MNEVFVLASFFPASLNPSQIRRKSISLSACQFIRHVYVQTVQLRELKINLVNR